MTLPRFPSSLLADTACLHRGATSAWPLAKERVLILTPLAKERDSFIALVREQGLDAVACAGVEAFCREISGGACAAILAAECLNDPHGNCLAKAFSEQPAWSDFPLIVLA